MLRKWRRNIQRRVEGEMGKISVEKGLVISAVVGSAISVVLCSTNISEHNENNKNVSVPQGLIKNEQSIEVVAPKIEISKYDINEKTDIINKFKPIVDEAPAMLTTVVEDNNVKVEDELTQYVDESVNVVPEQQVLSAQETNVDINAAAHFDEGTVSATNVVETQQINKQIAAEFKVVEPLAIRKNAELVKQSGDNATEKIKPLAAVVNAKPQLADGVSKVSAQKTTKSDSVKDKQVKTNNQVSNKVVAAAVTTNEDKNKAISDGKIAIVTAEIVVADNNEAIAEVVSVNGENKIILSETTKMDDENNTLAPELLNPNSDNNNYSALQVNGELAQQEIVKPDSNEMKIDNQLNVTDDNKVIIIDNVVVAEVVTNDQVVLQAVNNEQQMYTIADKSDGSTTMTMISNDAEKKHAFVGMLSSADITVFKVSKGKFTYNGNYYAENNIKGLTMEQRISENIEKPSSDSTKVQGTYMTMDWKNNPSSDFFIGFNGSALVVYPLDNEAKSIVSATDSLNNRPIVASSIINALGNMKINLSQIQSVSIYAE